LIEYYTSRGTPFQVVNSVLWAEANRIIEPWEPAEADTRISAGDAALLIRRFPRGLLVRCTDGFHPGNAHSDWYEVICRRFVELSEYPSKKRSQIKRGLKNCWVKRVGAETIAAAGYEVHMAAYRRYRNAEVPSLGENAFKNNVLATKDFADLIEYWACYAKDRLVAYATVWLYDRIEANYTAVRLHPDHLECHPAYALFHCMNEHYLREQNFQYVNDGERSVLHESGVQQFPISKLGFEYGYTNLHVHYRPSLAFFFRLPSVVRRLAAKWSPRVAAVCELDRLAVRPKPLVPGQS